MKTRVVSRTAMDDAELAIGVVVGTDLRAPQEEIVGTPAEAGVEFVVHDRGQRRGVNLAGHERLVGRKLLVDIVVETVVILLAEMKREAAAKPDQKEGRSPKQDSVPVHRKASRHRGWRFRRMEL